MLKIYLLLRGFNILDIHVLRIVSLVSALDIKGGNFIFGRLRARHSPDQKGRIPLQCTIG